MIVGHALVTMPDRSDPNRFANEPKSGVRVAVDSIVQATLVELFNAYGVAFAPLPRSSAPLSPVPEVSVAAAFRHGSGAVGRLTLSLPSALLEHMKSGEPTSVRLDWARELANQLTGRIKNRFLPLGVRLEVGLLSLLETNLLQHQLKDAVALRVYLGRTLRGPVLVTIHGLPQDSSLSYVGGVSATEGSLLWL